MRIHIIRRAVNHKLDHAPFLIYCEYNLNFAENDGMTGLEIIGIIGVIGWAGDMILAELPIPQNSAWQVVRDVFKKMARIKG